MNIVPRFLLGGSSSLFTVFNSVETPLLQAPQTTKTSTSDSQSLSVKHSLDKDDKDDTKGKLTEKDLFAMIKDVDGLPNEMKSIVNNLKRTLDASSIAGISPQELSSTYLDSLYKLKVANQNKKVLDSAIEKSKKDGTLGEVAITVDGLLMATDKNGTIGLISLLQYQANPENYLLLTNSNLAWMRKYSPKLAFKLNDDITNTIENGMSYEIFQGLLDKAKTLLGNYKYEELGITGKEALAGLLALKGKTDEEKMQLINAAQGDTVNYTTINSSNVQNVQALITYLDAVLPMRAKVWAALKTGKSVQEASHLLISTYLSSNITLDIATKLDLPSSKSSNGSRKGAGASGIDDLEFNTPMKFLDGEGVTGTYVLNSGTSRAVQVGVTTMPLTKADGKPVGANSTLQDAVSGEYAGILDTNHASIAGHTINASSFGGIILNDGKISSVDYPCTIKDNGEIIPNTSPKIAKAKQEAEKLLRLKGINVGNPAHIKKYWKAINLAYKKFGLPDAYNDLGLPIGTWRRFGVINVTASDKVLGMLDMEDNPLLKEVTNDTTIDNLIQITLDKQFSKKGFFNSITGGYNRFYEGTLWIPLDVNYQAAAITTKTTAGQTRSLEVAQLARDARSKWNHAPAI